MNGNTRTMAFQMDAILFQRIKDHLYRTGLTQKSFIIDLIEQALTEAEAKLAADSEATSEPTGTDIDELDTDLDACFEESGDGDTPAKDGSSVEV